MPAGGPKTKQSGSPHPTAADVGPLDYRTLFEASPEILLVLLPDTPRFTMVAATTARFEATHTSADTLGRGLFEVFPDNPDDPSATGMNNLRSSLERVLSTRKPDTMAVQKYDIRGPDGSFQTKYWSPKNIPVLSESGEVAYILHRVEDVTDLVAASELGEELRDRTRAMEREVVTRSRELAEANRNLREANAKLGELDAAKTAFFSNVSHEFRTPLTLILSPLEAAMTGQRAAFSPEELASLHRNAVRLLRMVNSLLDFSRLEAGRVEVAFEATDLATLTAGLAGAFHSLLDDAGLKLAISCPPLPEVVYVDPGQWEKIVLNLVSNAFKFTLEGEIAVSLSWCGDHVELCVRDTGTGIPEHELPRIFERFHRVEGAQGRSFEGTGIGLSLVHELAKLHGGSVSVQSVLGQGSSFTVSIPTGYAHLPAERITRREPRREPSTRAPSGHVLEAKQWLRSLTTDDVSSAPVAVSDGASAPVRTRGRLLLADDNSDMRRYLVDLLSRHWEVHAVADGKAALARAREGQFDLILSDVMMPELDGIGLLGALRADPATQTLPVILISARAGDEERLEGLETGADDYLVKPFSARELLTRVNTHLAMGKLRRAAAETARELAETRSRLVAELEQKNRDLQESYQRLTETQTQLVQSAKMASLGQLVAGVAHEINNPLAFSLSHLSTVARSLAQVDQPVVGDEPPDARAQSLRRASDRLREVQTGLSRIQELVTKLRTFSRLDEGERKRISFRESVASVLTILSHRLEGRIEVITELGEPDTIECFASLMNQALMNLLTNGIDAIPGKGTIVVTAGADGADYVISISDNGVGIPESVRERVFEPFFTTKAVGNGMGLGLSITYGIVEKHGGTLALSAAEGGGTNAVIRLPISNVCPAKS